MHVIDRYDKLFGLKERRDPLITVLDSWGISIANQYPLMLDMNSIWISEDVLLAN